MSIEAGTAVDAVYRSDWGRIVATLIGMIGDFDLAEECAQEAFAAAVDQWRNSGVPEFPRADSIAAREAMVSISPMLSVSNLEMASCAARAVR